MKPTHLTPRLPMKTVFTLVLLLSGAGTSLAQAVLDVYFSNFGPGLNAPVYNEDGVTGLYGQNFRAELTYDTTPLGTPGVAAVTPSVQFVVTGLPGYFGDGTTRHINGFDAGDSVTLWVRAWDSNTGATFDEATLRGISSSFSLTVPSAPQQGQPPPMAQWLAGLQSFQLQTVPEPVETAAVFAAACLIASLCRRLRRQPFWP